MSIERFPSIQLLPSPETSESRLDTARNLMLGQFTLAHAPITGRHVGCVLETVEGRLFGGHNYENENPATFIHAEANTLDTMDSDQAIQTVYMGRAEAVPGIQQLKNIAPCPDCYTLLEPRLTPDASLVLFEPGSPDKTTVFSADEYRPAYSKLPYSELAGRDRDQIIQELREKTILRENDLSIVADLRLLGMKTGIEFYLTGSASGRGAISTAIHQKLGTSYGDVDILAITDQYTKEDLSELVSGIVARQYGHNAMRTVETETDYWVVCGNMRGTRRHVLYHSYFANDKKVMDFSWATDLRTGMLRDDYYDNNFYHKIS